MKRMTAALAKGFVCEQCVRTLKEPKKEISFFDLAEFVKNFCYLGARLNEAAVRARTRIEWIKFKEYGLLYVRKFSLKMKRRIYQSCVKSAMLYGSETW